MSQNIYRFICDGIGIYEAVDKYCPRDDKRRDGKPDGSWLPKVGEKYPGAISYWTEKGLKKYQGSGLRDWHYSVVEGQSKMIIASMPEKVLYQDELQVICSPDEVSIVKEYSFTYEGPKPSIVPSEDSRPDFIRHHSSLRDWNAYSAYTGSDESFTLVSSIGKDLGLKKIGIHHEILKPGKRSSWPHAHKMEEELVFIISGNAEIWVNGKLYSAGAGDLVFFEPGANLAHTVINNSDEDIEMIVLGEQDSKGDLIHYPQHPDRNEECRKGGYYWEDKPQVDFGDHDGNPGKHSLQLEKYPKSVNINEVEAKVIGGETEPGGINILDKDLGRSLGIKNVAFHHILMKPGFKSSTPHAESNEEEFIYVLKGKLKAWINGELIPIEEGDSVAFPSGTGITHTLINDSNEDVELIVSGETTKKDNQCIFPLNPEMKADMGDFWWDDWPEQEFKK